MAFIEFLLSANYLAYINLFSPRNSLQDIRIPSNPYSSTTQRFLSMLKGYSSERTYKNLSDHTLQKAELVQILACLGPKFMDFPVLPCCLLLHRKEKNFSTYPKAEICKNLKTILKGTVLCLFHYSMLYVHFILAL